MSLMKSHALKNLKLCALRGRKFISKNHSKIHSKRSTEKNPYNCTMFGKGIIFRNHTKRHMKSFTREHLYQCVLCCNIIVKTSKVQKMQLKDNKMKRYKRHLI